MKKNPLFSKVSVLVLVKLQFLRDYAKASKSQLFSNSEIQGLELTFKLEENSITGSTQPLFVIDGTLMSMMSWSSGVDGVGQSSRLNDINPNDIEKRVQVLGASAAALWGLEQ
jgi:hypothetical protein